MKKMPSLYSALLLIGFCAEIYAQEALPVPQASLLHVASPEGDFKLELPSAKVWSFRTALGKIKIPLSGLESIQCAADGASIDVYTRAGDRWVAERPNDLIKAVRGQAGLPVDGLHVTHRVAETNPPIEGLWNFALADQGFFSGTLIDQVFKVEGGISTTSLAVNEIQKISVINRNAEGLTLRTVLRSGEVYMLNPLQSRINAVDRFGNTLKIELVDLISLRAAEVQPQVEIPVLPQRIRVVLEEGAEQVYEIPGSLISLTTARGGMTLPSSELLELRRAPGSKQVWVQTVYGDILVGKLNSKTWRLMPSVEDTDEVVIATRKISQVVFGNDPIQVKNGQWWHMVDGSRVRATFKRPSYRLRINTDSESRWEDIPSGRIHLVEPAEDGRIVIASGNKRFAIRPLAPTFDMVLDYNGQEYSVPWTSLFRIEKLVEQETGLLEWMSFLDPELKGLVTQEQVSEVLINAGSFWMGRQGGFGLDDEQPAHKVNLSAFYIDQYEVSLGEFKRFVEAESYITEAERSGSEFIWSQPGFPQEDNEPVVLVSWFDAIAYCNWRSRGAGLRECYSQGPKGEWVCDFTTGGYRLPTEAEWEFVASERGALKRFPWGESEAIADGAAYANFSQARSEPFDGFVWTAPVDAFSSNALGLYGLTGNVWEWCEDWYHHDAYFLVHRRKTNNPVVLAGDAPGLSHKVMRGGSFRNEVDFLRCASRGSGLPIGFAERIGFRCVRGLAHSEEN